MQKEKKLIEAALFMSPTALSVSDLMRVIDSNSYGETKTIAFELLKEFNDRDSALELTCFEDNFQMRVKPEFDSKVANFAAESRFNKGTMKTLALIAFKQPIMQSSVIRFRNNKAYDHISRLVGEGFIAREPKGRSYLLRTTKKFLLYFGEGSLKK